MLIIFITRITNDDISVILLFFHIDKHAKCPNTIENETISKSRRYSNNQVDMDEDPDIPSSVYHSLSEANLTINTTRQSCRDPFYTGLYDLFPYDQDTITSRMSLDHASLHSSKEDYVFSSVI